MEKYYYKHKDKNGWTECTEDCNVKSNTKIKLFVKIGSYTCRRCENCIGFDTEEKWIKCTSLKEAANQQ